MIEPNDRLPFYSNLSQSIIALLGSILIGLLGLKIYNIIKRQTKSESIKPNDMYMLVMIALMSLELLSKCLFHAFNAETVFNGFLFHHMALLYFISIIPVYLLGLACTINLRNWVHFYIRISEAAYMSQINMSDSNTENKAKLYHKKIKRKHLVVKITMIIIFLLVSIILGVSTYISYKYKNIGKYIGRCITSLGFAILGFTFMFFGIRILQKLRFAFKDFY